MSVKQLEVEIVRTSSGETYRKLEYCPTAPSIPGYIAFVKGNSPGNVLYLNANQIEAILIEEAELKKMPGHLIPTAERRVLNF